MNIPGVVAGLDYLYRHYSSGKVAWADLVAPAIRLADEGFVLDDALPTTIAEGRQYPREISRGGEALPAGRPRAEARRSLRQQGLRRDAARDREGRRRRVLPRRDREADRGRPAGERRHHRHRRSRAVPRHRAHAARPDATAASTSTARAPPLSDGVRIIETLQILDNYKPRPGARFTTDPDYFHYLIESWKVRDSVRIADPALLARGPRRPPAAPARRGALRDDRPAPRVEAAGQPARRGAVGAADAHRRGTTAFAVGDADGNVIAVTQTLSTWGGNFYVSKGLGFLYNDHLRSNRTTPGYGSAAAADAVGHRPIRRRCCSRTRAA